MLPKPYHEHFYEVALSFVPEIGPRSIKILIAHLGSAEEIFRTPVKTLAKINGIGELRARGFASQDILRRTETEIERAEQLQIDLLTISHPGYPKRFLNCEDAPPLLYFKGRANLNAIKSVAIIGTRRNTDYGQRATEALVEGLASQPDLLIVSGLAAGIDTIAHRSSLRHGIPTVGVLGHGVDSIFPSSNRMLAEEMVADGGLLSEFPIGTRADRRHFPIRNRVVAAISDVTVLVESEVRGGGMITAYMANSYNREVAAFPGRVFDSKSGGPNRLIKMNIAALITGSDDLCALMNWATHKNDNAKQQQLFVALTPAEEKIVDLLRGKDGIHADDLLVATGFSSSQLAGVLLQLEMNGIIKVLPGKLYRLN